MNGIDCPGVVATVVSRNLFEIKLRNGFVTKGFLPKSEQNKILICLGDEVVVRLSAFDPSAGCIVSARGCKLIK